MTDDLTPAEELLGAERTIQSLIEAGEQAGIDIRSLAINVHNGRFPAGRSDLVMARWLFEPDDVVIASRPEGDQARLLGWA